eukprot:2471215-Prymnesium_polylepis.1
MPTHREALLGRHDAGDSQWRCDSNAAAHLCRLRARIPRDASAQAAPGVPRSTAHHHTVSFFGHPAVHATRVLARLVCASLQALVISGVSGAGKTEAAKYALHYLCWRSREEELVHAVAAAPAAAPAAASWEPLTRAILRSNPVFEALGNATTVNNPNSSRFGKFIKIYFSPSGAVAGGRISTVKAPLQDAAFVP